MGNEHGLFITLLLDPLPDGQAVFNKIWELSPLGALLLVVAIACAAAAVFQFVELRNERKTHQEACKEKEKALAQANEQLHVLLANATNATLGLINKLEVMSVKLDTGPLKAEVEELARSTRNGLRAVGNKLNIPPERMNLD